jgi:hypothetical protein
MSDFLSDEQIRQANLGMHEYAEKGREILDKMQTRSVRIPELEYDDLLRDKARLDWLSLPLNQEEMFGDYVLNNELRPAIDVFMKHEEKDKR